MFFIQEIIDKYPYKIIEPIGSRPGVSHGLGENRKDTKNASISHYCNYKRAKYFATIFNTLNSL